MFSRNWTVKLTRYVDVFQMFFLPSEQQPVALLSESTGWMLEISSVISKARPLVSG
jgi:hypothetical protein